MIATLVNNTHNRADDSNTPSSNSNINHMAITFNGKLSMVPMIVSLMASFQAPTLLKYFLSLSIY